MGVTGGKKGGKEREGKERDRKNWPGRGTDPRGHAYVLYRHPHGKGSTDRRRARTRKWRWKDMRRAEKQDGGDGGGETEQRR